MAGRQQVRRGASALRWWATVTIVAMASVSVAACGDDDAAEGDPTGTDELDATLARVQDYLDAQPDALATSIGAMTLTPVTPDQVRAVATVLCESTFAPQVTVDWIEGFAVGSSYLMVGPASRLLRLAGSPEICQRPPTPEEQAAYEAGVYGAFGTPQGEIPALSGLPTGTEHNFCQMLDSAVGGAAAESTLSALLDLATRGGIEPGEFLPFAVEVAGSTCDRWLPQLDDALRDYFGS